MKRIVVLSWLLVLCFYSSSFAESFSLDPFKVNATVEKKTVFDIYAREILKNIENEMGGDVAHERASLAPPRKTAIPDYFVAGIDSYVHDSPFYGGYKAIHLDGADLTAYAGGCSLAELYSIEAFNLSSLTKDTAGTENVAVDHVWELHLMERPFNVQLLKSDGKAGPHAPKSGSLSIYPVPEPATILLLAAGMVGLSATRSKKKR